MDFKSKPASNRRSIKLELPLLKKYPEALHFYEDSPDEVITLQEYESMAVLRLKLLRIIDSVLAKHGNAKKYSDAYKNELIQKVEAENLKPLMDMIVNFDSITEEQLEWRRKDYLSHYICRLAFCRTDEDRKWFVEQETELFRLRWTTLDTVDKSNFVRRHKLFNLIDDNRKEELYEDIADVYGNYLSQWKVMNTPVVEVRFTEVEHLLRTKRLVLKKGFVYLPLQEVQPMLCKIFRTKLSLEMALTRQALPELEEDKRLFRLLKGLSNLYTGKDYVKKDNGQFDANNVDAAAIPSLSNESFPPCMKTLHRRMTTAHHLKNGGRLQYGLFLKGIGLKLEEAVKFFRSEFCKSMSEDDFVKKYQYNIRYNYGQEGKRANYIPRSCRKIIMENTPGPNDDHGCPFRHYNKENLRSLMCTERVQSKVQEKIFSFVETKHYDVACSCFFEAKHGVAPSQIISHPNQYFEESRKIIEGKTQQQTVPTLPTVPTVPQQTVQENGQKLQESLPKMEETAQESVQPIVKKSESASVSEADVVVLMETD